MPVGRCSHQLSLENPLTIFSVAGVGGGGEGRGGVGGGGVGGAEVG